MDWLTPLQLSAVEALSSWLLRPIPIMLLCVWIWLCTHMIAWLWERERRRISRGTRWISKRSSSRSSGTDGEG